MLIFAEVVAVVGAVAAAMWALDRWLNRRDRTLREQIDRQSDDENDLVCR